MYKWYSLWLMLLTIMVSHQKQLENDAKSDSITRTHNDLTADGSSNDSVKIADHIKLGKQPFWLFSRSIYLLVR